MTDFKLLSLAHLKRIARYYNKHIQIKGVSKMSKEDLIKNLEIHLFINELGEIKLKEKSNMKIPKNPKNDTETLKDDIKGTKKLVKSLEKFSQLQKSKESDDLLETNKKMLKELEDKLNSKKKLKGKGIDDEELEGGANGFALHAVLVDKSIPFEEAFKQAQEIIKKKKFFHRESKNQYRFRNIPKQKFEPKSFKSKKINKDLTLVFGKLKSEHMHLEGAGIFDWFKEKASKAVSAVKDYFKPRLDGYNNISKKTIEQYGNMPIKQLFILRTPISGGLNKVINFVSLGKWEELKKKYSFDSLFHLSLVALLENGKNIIIEKNDVVNISPEYKMYPTSETVDIPLGNNNLTINKLLETARAKVGDNTFFSYDAFKNNCQFFIRYLLEGQNLYTEQAKNFLFQDLENIYKDLPSYVPKVMKGATTMGAIVNKILGKGKDKIIMNPDDFIKEHKKLIALLRKFDEPELLKEAKEQAKELKKETGVDLIGGEMKMMLGGYVSPRAYTIANERFARDRAMKGGDLIGGGIVKVHLSQSDRGWSWEIREDGVLKKSSTRYYPTEDEAYAGARLASEVLAGDIHSIYFEPMQVRKKGKGKLQGGELLRIHLSKSDGGWSWNITDDGVLIKSSTRYYPTEEEAYAGARLASDVLSNDDFSIYFKPMQVRKKGKGKKQKIYH